MIEHLTERVVVEVQGGVKHVVPCTPGDSLVVALVPTVNDYDALTVTHVGRGWNVLGDATFPAHGIGLDAAISVRDELLTLPMRWDVDEPDPRGSGCIEEYTGIRRRANTWISNHWTLAAGD